MDTSVLNIKKKKNLEEEISHVQCLKAYTVENILK